MKNYNIFDKVETTGEFLEDTEDMSKQRIVIEINIEEKGIPYLSVRVLKEVCVCIHCIYIYIYIYLNIVI
mgnify:CR=1 FL=1